MKAITKESRKVSFGEKLIGFGFLGLFLIAVITSIPDIVKIPSILLKWLGL
jgi:hypothetical protein